MNFDTLQGFLFGLTDKAAILKKNSLQPNVATLARFAPYRPRAGRMGRQAGARHRTDGDSLPDNRDEGPGAARCQEHALPATKRVALHGAAWVARQWTADCRVAVGPSRAGTRATGGSLAAQPAGGTACPDDDRISGGPEKRRRDCSGTRGWRASMSATTTWPIRSASPQGQLRRRPAIASIARACQAHRSACGISAESAEDMQKRIKQGFRILGGGGIKGGLTPTADAALRAGRGAAR